VGDEITVADLCLIPQCYNARRYEIRVEDYPTIARIEALALQSDACKAAHPDRFAP
jgi:maleylacetoacetate isomerase/maleylpyruvate isomerase